MKKATTYSFFASLRMAILALIALGGLTMCGKNEVVAHEEDPWTALTGDSPITFTSATSGPVTKTTSPLTSTFGVFASFQQGVIGSGIHATGSAATFTPNYMYNEDVHYNAGPSYRYAPIKYWPNNQENTISFWAYSPYTGTENFLKNHGLGTNYSNTSTGIPDINFTLADGKTDLMVTHLNESAPYIVKDLSKPAVSGTVDLLFHHVLCKVNFIFRLSTGGHEVNLTMIRFDHVYQAGTYDSYNSPSSWQNRTGDISFTAFSGTQALSTSDTAVEGVMLIPQIMDDPYDVNLHIQYTVDDVEDVCDISLSTKHASWDENTQYTYTVTITPGVHPYIMFSADIKPWEEERGYYPLTL